MVAPEISTVLERHLDGVRGQGSEVRGLPRLLNDEGKLNSKRT